MNIVFCDDDPKSISSLMKMIKEYLEYVTGNLNCDVYDNPRLLISDIEQSAKKYDLHFIDIEMPIMGDIVVQKIREVDPQAICIFLSNFPNYGSMACHMKLNAYLYKDMTKNEIESELQNILENYNLTHRSFKFKVGKEYVLFQVPEIEYFESIKRKVVLHKTNGETVEVSRCTLSSIQTYDEFSTFIRISRGHLINAYCLSYMDPKTLKLKSGMVFDITTEQYRLVTQHLHKLVGLGLM